MAASHGSWVAHLSCAFPGGRINYAVMPAAPTSRKVDTNMCKQRGPANACEVSCPTHLPPSPLHPPPGRWTQT